MITLHGFIPAWGLPDISPFVVKVHTYLRMAKIEYKTVISDARKAPKGKLPYLTDGEKVIADSEFIIQYLQAKNQNNLGRALNPSQMALATAMRSMMEEHLYFILLYYRWTEPAGFAAYRPILKDYLRAIGIPAFLAPLPLWLGRRGVCTTVHGQGVGRHQPGEIAAMGIKLLRALAGALGEQAYFFGDEPALIDASLYALLSGFLTPPIDNPVRDFAKTQPNLVAYCERVRSRYF